MTENNYRILAIDDHPIVLQGIQALATELHNVSCTTKTDIRLEDLPEDSAFDLCILDLGLCGKQSGDFIARLRTRMPSCRILVYTMHEEPWIADELSPSPRTRPSTNCGRPSTPSATGDATMTPPSPN